MVCTHTKAKRKFFQLLQDAFLNTWSVQQQKWCLALLPVRNYWLIKNMLQPEPHSFKSFSKHVEAEELMR